MRIENLVINCTARYPRTCRRTPFEVVVYELNYSSEDKDLMDLLRTKAEELARQVNPGAANNSMHERSPERILADCIAGVVSEYFWKLYLNSEENVVSETEFDDASRQIDLKVISNNKKIEVRSSFPRNGIEFAICHPSYEFDVIGPYSNNYKLFCRRGYVNNCTDPNGGWALGCRIDGGQAEYVRVPYADQGLNRIPDTVSDEQALFVGDVLATGFWATRISEISEDDTVLIIGAGPTGICTLLCVMLKKPRRIIVCEKSPERIRFVREHYPDVLVVEPENCKEFVIQNSEHGGADVVLEVAGSKDTFRLAWECARPNAVVTIVALYDEPQILPLPDMYGKNLIFKTGGVDGCDCAEILNLIEEGKIDTTPLITHRFPLNEIEEAYRIFENKLDGVIKVAIYQ